MSFPIYQSFLVVYLIKLLFRVTILLRSQRSSVVRVANGSKKGLELTELRKALSLLPFQPLLEPPRLLFVTLDLSWQPYDVPTIVYMKTSIAHLLVSSSTSLST